MNIDQTILDQAIAKWGFNSQLAMLQEECMELAMAIHKFRTRDDSKENWIEINKEFADVMIMSQQFEKLTDMNYVQEQIDFKMNRLQQRINKNEKI